MIIAYDQIYENTPSSKRGIGRFSRELLHALYKRPSSYDFLPYTPDPSVTALEARKDLESFLASQKVGIYHIQAPFDYYMFPEMSREWFGDVKVSVMVHDIIPFLYPQYFLFSDEWKENYKKMMRFVSESDLILANSEYTKQDLIKHFNIDPSLINVIAAGVSLSFKKTDPKRIPNKYGITKPYLLYAGGGEIQKNVPSIIKAFGQIKENLKQEHQLVIAGDLSNAFILMFQMEARKAGVCPIFTGYVPEGDYLSLLSGASAFVFPSLYEGFGLPVLEAMACEVPVITSNVSSLPEVAGDAALLVNPLSISDISSAMLRILNNEKISQLLIEKGKTQVQKFSWEKSADRMILALGRLKE
ncbi:glycosyltransferase family 4 protein [Fictibacillus fluitans]|uniref:Glycosyltransferase family 1 protein n=1 Tax=Fictibacillus fluitans TaxID=3058422 RepID=A0ABT8HS64_9BACL|nr:glycosyltransferase family 1 protein [Fictibacillus sp. NE201]MDN4523620.1 glycosyltransferase family 1 protein [Fictibacillus sp. NE201]